MNRNNWMAVLMGLVWCVAPAAWGQETQRAPAERAPAERAQAPQKFVHPGGLHNQADLDRMKAKVAEKAHPWIDGYEKLCADPMAQGNYRPGAMANLGQSRQRAARDATAAYLNTIRWYISGEDKYADCAINIMNSWARSTNTVPAGNDVPGLSGIPIAQFANAAEVLRVCPRWQAEDQEKFKTMMRTYWYPAVHDFLSHHNGPGDTHFWANWNLCNISACISMGVFLDDREIFNEGLAYFYSDNGTGSIKNAVYFIHPNGMGQWQESGRDQAHTQLGVGLMGEICEVAWKQGVDLYGAENNRFLAGAEYVAQYDLWKDVPYRFYNNSSNSHQSWPAINSRGRTSRPVWELVYNHYVVRKGLSAPNVTAFARLTRVERGSGDHFGYGTLTFMLDGAKSPFPPAPVPPPPADLKAEAGVGQVFLNWRRSGDTTTGYEVRRGGSPTGPFTAIASWDDNTGPLYVDDKVQAGSKYYYVVASRNQAGTSDVSAPVSATPVAAGDLPADWTVSEIGKAQQGSAKFADICGKTFILQGSADGIGRRDDSVVYLSRAMSGDQTLTARLLRVDWPKGGRGTKVGIMVRQSLDAKSAVALMKLGDVGARQAGAGHRAASGADLGWNGGNDYTWLPAWFRVQKSGQTVVVSESSDGQKWFEVSSTPVSLEGEYRVGFFVTSGTDATTTAVFDHVSVTR